MEEIEEDVINAMSQGDKYDTELYGIMVDYINSGHYQSNIRTDLIPDIEQISQQNLDGSATTAQLLTNSDISDALSTIEDNECIRS